MRSFIFCTHPKYYADEIKENEVGWACCTHGRGEEIVQCFSGKVERKETSC
jgi:hypothetical protein